MTGGWGGGGLAEALEGIPAIGLILRRFKVLNSFKREPIRRESSGRNSYLFVSERAPRRG